MFYSFLIALVFSASLIVCPAFADNREAVLKKELSYLVKAVPQIKWVKFKNNNVYIGWDFPENVSWFKILSAVPDFKIIVHAAAMTGNRAIDFGVHIWSVSSEFKNNPDDAPVFCSMTARYGKIEESDCK